MAKFYAVKIGRKPGIYNSWDECKMQVDKFKGAVYKSFSNKEDALMFIEEKKVHFNNGLIAYVDGSYNVKTKEYGFGCVIIEGQQVIKEMYGKGNDENYVSMRNVAGEILGSICAMEYANSNGYSSKYGIKPAMNLKENVIITGGTGTKNDPFQISLSN